MVRIFKTLSVILCIASVAVFSLVGWGKATIPDELFAPSDVKISVNDIFTGSIDDKAAAAKSGGESKLTVNFSLLKTIPVKSSTLTVSQRRYVVAGGTILGLKLYTKGVTVVGMDSVQTAAGSVNPAADAGIAEGDSIISIDGQTVTTTAEVAALFQQSEGKPLIIVYERDSVCCETTFTLALCSSDGRYKAGLWIRDSAAGIGTMTYYDSSTGIYASLGHAVCDVDTGDIMSVSQGECVPARITGCYKGSTSAAGELCGVFSAGSLGSLVINGRTGAFGVLSNYDIHAERIPVATASEVKTGHAQIISTVDEGNPQYYDIEIVKLYKSEGDDTKSMAIKVTDSGLIDKTGGIVQGMSGSPIIQDGMLVGAVTHVFVNDPTQGYAIYAEKMIETSDSLASLLFNEAA